jgi:DNA-binding CsgD family transcriptional regulator
VKKNDQTMGVISGETRIEQAEARAEQAEARTEQARIRAELAETRTEQAESRTEQAESRTELAKTRTEQAEIRTEQAKTRTEQCEKSLQHIDHQEVDPPPRVSTPLLKNIATTGMAGHKNPLEQLTVRQREILQLIAEGRNTKQIGDILKVSPKTVEYHRMKLMDCLNMHDIPGLVRFALRAGLLPLES